MAVEVYVVGPIEREKEGLVVIWFTEPLVLFVCWSDIMCGPTRYTPPPALLSFGS